MTILLQVCVFFLVLSALILAARLALALLVRLWVLPPLLWWGLGTRLYPQWAAANPLLFYGVLAALVLAMLARWIGPPLMRLLEDRQMERTVRDEIARAHTEGRVIDGIRLENGVPVTTYRD